MREILIENARENNLKNVSLRIPHYKLIVVTGVSGSGKTSLVYDVIAAEGRRLMAQHFIGGRDPRFRGDDNAFVNLAKPRADRIEGLFPLMVVGQSSVVRNPRSTVGTLTELYDLLRLLFARLGKSEIPSPKLHRSLFSFNHPDGYCPVCKGLGVQDHIDPALLIGDPAKTIREGAFALTTPNNYIIYSQVTMAVLDQVCRAEGFTVDIPWQELTAAQKNVVLNGSAKIKVLFGKHPLESRLKWTGITAKPRDEDYYKGILPVMEDILRRDRNPNIMRFARSQTCEGCGGRRLNDQAVSVKLWDKDISEYAAMSIRQLHAFFIGITPSDAEAYVLNPVREVVLRRTTLLMKLGAGHLPLDCESPSLSIGESQRIKLANQALGGLRNVLYILDEPSVGLHPSEQRDLLDVMRSLVAGGNTVIVVDHDEQTIREADWIIDIGPGAGAAGGRILYNGPAEKFFGQQHEDSVTWRYLTGRIDYKTLRPRDFKTVRPRDFKTVRPRDFKTVRPRDGRDSENSLSRFLIGGLNVITGVSGSGKASLVNNIVANKLWPGKVITVDSSPIGRTPKSNPATYTGLSDYVRDLLAAQSESHRRGYKKGQFSFVVKGGRCESCGGAGVQQIGMHFLGNVDVVCEACEGKRFTDETLEIHYRGLNIHDILELTVDEANRFFEGEKKITSITGILSELGLGYLHLGQPSTTLSGGEAQRVKLATELSRPATGNTLYILHEPTTGLHMADVEILVKALKKLTARGNTLICVENDEQFVGEAENVVEMVEWVEEVEKVEEVEEVRRGAIRLLGVETNNLKNIDVSFPVDAITVVTGVSGSGKSSLVYGTLYAESQRRFMEGTSSYSRQHTVKAGVPVLREGRGLVPSVALQKKNPVRNPRSTIATYTGLYDLYRLLFSRMAVHAERLHRPYSNAFSFNTEEGACPVCKGLGTLTVCDPDRLVTDPAKPLIAGALDGSKTGRFYGDPYGQYVAALLTVGQENGIDFSVSFKELDHKAKEIALRGCGDEVFTVDWSYRRGNVEGVHRLSTTWPGFLSLVETEYIRKHADARGEAMLDLMKSDTCSDCAGYRLKPGMLEYTVGGLHIGQVTALSAAEAVVWFGGFFSASRGNVLEQKIAAAFEDDITGRLEALQKAGLGYISTDRIVGTLSGGEFQRLQLAGLVRAPLTGVAYILDEPSFGLHPKDISRISDLILDLNRHGNTVILVDHSPQLLEIADYRVELGPGAGAAGGEIVYAGPQTADNRPQKTADGGGPRSAVRGPSRSAVCGLRSSSVRGLLSLQGAHANNLRNIDIEIDTGTLTVVTGVSGSGKTTLLDRVIYPSYLAGRAVGCESVSGFEHFSNLIYIEQPLPGKGYTATAGSMLGLSGLIASMFAELPASKGLGFKASHFTPGSREGRCPACEGSGINSVSLDFFADAVSPCERCGGTGFRDEVMEVRISDRGDLERVECGKVECDRGDLERVECGKVECDRGLGDRGISEVLGVPFSELSSILEGHLHGKARIQAEKILSLVQKTGLGHLACGRTLKTLSAGELQRVKLVSGLSALHGNSTLFLLDEPTGGLHSTDIARLLVLFRELTDAGNTVICVTHERLLMEAAGTVIELGPGGGKEGGRVVK